MNLILNCANKKRVVSTLFLYLLLFSLGCDFKPPEKWETPSWYLPLTVPLINKVYSFEGMVDSSMIFSDSLSNVIQVVFGDSLPANGIPDETFNIDMSTGGLEPSIGMSGKAIPVPGAIPVVIPTIAIPMPLFESYKPPFGSCFPQSKIEDIQNTLAIALNEVSPGTLPMPLSFESDTSVNIKQVIIIDGHWLLKTTNQWAVPVLVSLVLNNGEASPLYSHEFSKIDPYDEETKIDSLAITSDSTDTLNVNSEFSYIVDISILNEDTNCLGFECSTSPVMYDTEASCQIACGLGICTSYNGWTVDPVKDELLSIEFSAFFNKIGSVVADVNIETPSADPLLIEIPAMEGIEITRAKFADYTEEYPNQFQFNISNGFIADLNMIMSYKNIFDSVIDSEGEIDLTDSLIIPMKIKPSTTLDTIISISEKFLAYGSNSEEPVKFIEIGYEVGIESGEYTIDVVNDSIKIGVPSINSIGVTNLRLEYIAAVTDSLPFPPIESPPIEGIPDGFSGFEFYDIIMEIEFFNEIGVPVGLNMELLGSKADSAETITVAIDTQIGAPYRDNYNCNFNTTGDTARTLIKLNKDYQLTEYYCNSTDSEPSQIILDTLNSSGNGSNSSIVDLMNFAPENIGIGGGVLIDGPGILSPGSQIWGTFTLIAPLAFIFRQPINIIPAEPTSMAPMDPSTSQQIDSALVEAALNVTITNKSPLGGNLSLLISDSTIYPLFLDSLITGTWTENEQYQIDNFGYNIDTSIWDTLRQDLTEVIDSISYKAIDPTDEKSKALEVEFFRNDSLQFFIGRMFELGFPATDSIEYHLGYVNPEFPEIYTSGLIIDTTRMAWVITEEPRYNIAMITFDKSPIQSISGSDTAYIPLTFQTTNTIGVQAYLTLTLDTGGLGREANSNDK